MGSSRAAEAVAGLSDREGSNHNERSEEEIQPLQDPRQPNLSSLQIPVRSLESPLPTSTRISIPSLSSPASTRAGLPPRPNSTKAKTSVRNLISQSSFKAKGLSPEGERSGLLVSGAPSSGESLDKASILRTFSLTKVLSFSWSRKTHSLPVTPDTSSGPGPGQGRHVVVLPNLDREDQKHITRSVSVPGNIRGSNFQRTDSVGSRIRIIPATPRPVAVDVSTANDIMPMENATEEDGEDIPEEDAVCRICFVELAEGGETLKMECSCKGELALAHQECAVKWFSIKGNKTCDICRQDVQNLPVTLLRIQNPTANRRQPDALQQSRVERFRVWQDIPVLTMVSTIAYFCFLEQLLATNMGPSALAISLPFSCVLGLLSSLIASTMVTKRYIWAFSLFQFATVIMFTHIFYNVIRVSAVFSVLLSSITGFGIAISSNSLLVEYLNWRIRRSQPASQQHNGNTQHQESRENLGTANSAGQHRSGNQSQ